MSFESGERRAAELLTEVGLPDPFDVVEFCRRVAAHRGRPLALVPRPAGAMGEAVGAYVGREDRDEVHYVAETSSYHQNAIILHEVGHLVSEHSGRTEEPFPLSLLGADWDPTVVKRLKGRHRYHDEEECEAEGFATAILDEVDRQARARAVRPQTASARQARLSSMFVQ